MAARTLTQPLAYMQYKPNHGSYSTFESLINKSQIEVSAYM